MDSSPDSTKASKRLSGRAAIGPRIAAVWRWLRLLAPWPVFLAALSLLLCTVAATAGFAALDGIRYSQARAAELAAGVLDSVQTIDRQIDTSLALSRQGPPGPPCGAAQIAHLQSIHARHSYVGGVARLDQAGDRVLCSTLGPAAQRLALSAQDLVRVDGTRRVYRRVKLPEIDDVEYFVMADAGVAVFVHSKVAVTLLATLQDASLGAYLPPDGPMLFSRGAVDIQAIRELERSGRPSSFDGQQLLGVAHADGGKYVAFVAFPPARVIASIRHSAATLLPLGILLGLAISTLLFLLLRDMTSMAGALRRAIGADRVYMEYQPILKLASGRCVGAEALVRWSRAGHPVAPDRFIVAAERAGMMPLVTARIVALVTRDMADFLRRYPDFHISINFSALDLRSGYAAELLVETLKTTGLPPSQFWIEITETGLIEEEVAQTVDQIRARGMCVAVDDFGTGYSHLGVLQKMKVDILKIDKEFVHSISETGRASEVAVAIIGLGRSLSLEMVAEGIETTTQARFLADHGVQFGQGWLYGRPGPVAALEALMAGQADADSDGKPAMA